MDLNIPNSLFSKQDIVLLHRELRLFTDSAMQSIMSHEEPVKYPPISDNLRALAVDNQVDLKVTKSCDKLLYQLEDLKKSAPMIHISFPSEPSKEDLQKLIVWLRKEIDSKVIIQIGLQPTMAAGIMLRTPNKVFDFSIRRHLHKSRDNLVKALQL